MGLSSSRVPATLNHPQAKFVQQAVAQNCVVIFSKTTCPFCVQTKEIFRNLGIPYTAVELNNHPQGPEIQNYLADVTQARTVSSSMFTISFYLQCNTTCKYLYQKFNIIWFQVPRVFINGNCIGGASDTKTLHKSGQLLDLVGKCHNPQIEQVRSWHSTWVMDRWRIENDLSTYHQHWLWFMLILIMNCVIIICHSNMYDIHVHVVANLKMFLNMFELLV